MNEIRSRTLNISEAATDPVRRQAGLAALSVLGAFLASACCIVPLLLVMVGVSGAWIGNLTILEPYKLYISAATLVPLGFGFWQVYFKPKTACEPGSYCARPQSSENGGEKVDHGSGGIVLLRAE